MSKIINPNQPEPDIQQILAMIAQQVHGLTAVAIQLQQDVKELRVTTGLDPVPAPEEEGEKSND